MGSRFTRFKCCVALLAISAPLQSVFADSIPPSVQPTAQPTDPPPIQSLLKPDLYKRAMNDKEILTSATLDGDHYSFYSVMLVHSGLPRARRILTDYSLYSKLIPYVDKTDYSPITRILDVQGGVWKWRLRSFVRFEERGDRWIHFQIVAGHFRGLQGDMFFESEGEKGTLVFFRGDQRGKEWPPRLVIERGAEIVFGFTAGRMRKYVESNEDSQGQAEPQGQPSHGPTDRPEQKDLPKPRNRL
jgi:hypothetical protein